MRKLDNKAWEMGYNAYFDNLSKKANPYRGNDDQDEDDWDAGWDCARNDSN